MPMPEKQEPCVKPFCGIPAWSSVSKSGMISKSAPFAEVVPRLAHSRSPMLPATWSAASAEHNFAGSLKCTDMVEVARSPLAEKKGGERTLLCGYDGKLVSLTAACSPARWPVLSKTRVGVRRSPRRKRRPETESQAAGSPATAVQLASVASLTVRGICSRARKPATTRSPMEGTAVTGAKRAVAQTSTAEEGIAVLGVGALAIQRL
mmetsp:Transcript_15309/g.36235  ORF Transcript_15309/g.36235 Transcript_15309/m.36235 type:complete len:207 (-) Transcript_15309:27-647(-)